MAAGTTASVNVPAPRPCDPSKPFDIHQTYLDLLNTTPPQPPALAAITALTSALSHHHFTTATEALSLLDNLAKELKSHVADPIPLSAGTDLFLHYLVNDFARSRGETAEFETTTEDVKAVGQRFVQRGLRARSTIKKFGRKLIRDGMTVIVPEIDELVMGLVVDAAEAEVDFRVVFLGGSGCENVGKSLDSLEVPWTTIPQDEVASTMLFLSQGKETTGWPAAGASTGDVIVLASAAAVLSTGAIWSSPCVLQTAMLAKTLGFHVIVPSEMMRMVTWTPSRKVDPRPQWRHDEDTAARTKDLDGRPRLDVTPACYITQFLTENGAMVPDAIAEEAIKIWF